MRAMQVLKACPHVEQMWVGAAVEVVADEIVGYPESHHSKRFNVVYRDQSFCSSPPPQLRH